MTTPRGPAEVTEPDVDVEALIRYLTLALDSTFGELSATPSAAGKVASPPCHRAVDGADT